MVERIGYLDEVVVHAIDIGGGVAERVGRGEQPTVALLTIVAVPALPLASGG